MTQDSRVLTCCKVLCYYVNIFSSLFWSFWIMVSFMIYLSTLKKLNYGMLWFSVYTISSGKLCTTKCWPFEARTLAIVSNHEWNNYIVHLAKILAKKFAGFGFSKHATWAYLPSLSTCLGSPLVSFLQILQVLSTQPSSTYCPSTEFEANLVGQYSVTRYSFSCSKKNNQNCVW
jgi:hypothetical protein